MKLSKQEKNNLKEGIADLKKSILKDEEGLVDAKKCLEYMALNYYDKQIEKKITEILEVHIGKLEELIHQHCSEIVAYESVLKK